MAQALALLHNRIGPHRDARRVLLHHDVKPENILVMDNGTTYISLKFHDFGVAGIYRKSDAFPPKCQPPENPTINTRAAEVWSLGVSVHCLATGTDPLQDPEDYKNAVLTKNACHPDSAQIYADMADYYAARAPQIVLPIYLSSNQQRNRGIGPFLYDGREYYNPQ